MIVTRIIGWKETFKLVWKDIVYSGLVAFVVWAVIRYYDVHEWAIDFAPIGILGSALAIFLAFRNNSAYDRWWEARKIWGTLVNWSRTYARLLISIPSEDYEDRQLIRQIVNRHVAFVHALRFHLRHQDSWQRLKPHLTEEEYEELIHKKNKPNHLLYLSAQQIQENKHIRAVRKFQLDQALSEFSNHQGACERIKNTPMPRQYEAMTKFFTRIFTLILPLGLFGLFEYGQYWMTIPLTVIIAGAFITIEKTGAAIEDPFENTTHDIPLTSLCNTIERDLKEQLGDNKLPPKMQVVHGFLY